MKAQCEKCGDEIHPAHARHFCGTVLCPSCWRKKDRSHPDTVMVLHVDLRAVALLIVILAVVAAAVAVTLL